GTPPGGLLSRPVIDDDGHGTGTTSVAAGGGESSLRAPFGSNPEALIVSLEGLGDEGVKWASEQPWIDFISGSYGDPLAIPCNDEVDDMGVWCGREYRYTAPFVLRDSRTACFSAGNGLTRTGVLADRYSSLRPTSGPSWVITVGAVSPRNEQDYGWHSVPVDISSYGLHWPAADPFSTAGEQSFGGTSNATPVTCGVFSKALLEARKRLGDAAEGIHTTPDGETVAAVGPPNRAGGLLGDGVLTRTELERAVFTTAEPGEFDPNGWTYDPIVVPTTPVYYTQQGYGTANVASAFRAVDVITGAAPMPVRGDVDAWIALVDSVRETVYPSPGYP
ncbi:MAG TPA: S8/S53 family peptidase, partial [Gaiellaceae bacterium]|nr:S8/S53 family peptidase [Gaiellaceae bacterium]